MVYSSDGLGGSEDRDGIGDGIITRACVVCDTAAMGSVVQGGDWGC